MKSPFLWYLLAVNLAAFFAMRTDKRRAVRGGRRIPERRLLWLAAVGGSAGALFGMYRYHHKTRKAKFYLGFPLIAAAQVIGGLLLAKRRSGL